MHFAENQKTSEKSENPLDKSARFEYNINVATREWRNWQTRTFEGRVVYTVRVQVPSLAPASEPDTSMRVSGFCFDVFRKE